MATSAPPSGVCPGSGTQIDVGIDENGDGTLQPGEANPALTRYLCDGVNGAAGADGAAIVGTSTPEPAGANCATGGSQLQFGADLDGDLELDPGELNASLTTYLCNGAQGPAGVQGATGPQGLAGNPGTPGTDGYDSVVATSIEAAGANCATGGVQVQFGPDADRDGALDPEEINAALTRYVCNGPQGAAGVQGATGTAGDPGTDGYSTVVASSAEPAGANCATGGVLLQFGLDADRDGVLDAGEVDAALTRYVCNGEGLSGSNDYIQNVFAGGTQSSASISIDGSAVVGSGVILAPATATDTVFQAMSSDPFTPLFMVRGDGALWAGGQHTGFTYAPPKEGAGTRMMWHPDRAAFRAGSIDGTQWDDANIGNYSVAIGQNVRASGDYATAFGVRSTAAGSSTFAVGEDNTASGAASVALGYHAHTNARQGSFVFGDRSTVDTLRAGVNHSANWRTSGGFRVFTSSNLSTGVTIQSGTSVSNWGQSNAVISTSTGAYLSTGGVWTNVSDVNRKYRFEDLSGDEVLEKLRRMPIKSWSYRAEGEQVRHIGPTAQDFNAAFGLGNNNISIGTVDADGVALAAAQALERKSKQQAEEIAALRRANAELAARLERMEALLLGGRPEQKRGGR